MSNPVWTKQGVMITPNVHDLNGGSALSGTEEPNVLYEASPQILPANPDGKIYKMWFAGGNDICYAEANNRNGPWTRYAGTPNGVVLASYAHSRMFKSGSTYYLYANPHPSVIQIDCFTSSDGLTWALAQASALIAGATYDATIGQLNPIHISGGVWYAVYSCSDDPSGNGVWKAAQATSLNGLTWAKFGGVVTDISNVNVINVSGTYYGWGQKATFGTITSTPTDIFRMQFTDSTLTATVAGSYNEVFPRTDASEGFQNSHGQVADPALIEVNGQVSIYYTGTPSGNSGTGYTLQCATATLTFAQLVATNEGVILPNLLFMQNNQNLASANNCVTAFTKDTTGNSILFAQAIWDHQVAYTSIVDTLGNTWHQIGATVTGGGLTGGWALFYAVNKSAGGANTVTLTAVGSGFVELTLSEYIGQADPPIDASALVAALQPSNTTLTTPNITTMFTNETIVAFGRTGNISSPAAAGAGYTIRNTAYQGGGNKYEMSSDANKTVPGTYGTTFTVDTTETWLAGIVGVKSGSSISSSTQIGAFLLGP